MARASIAGRSRVRRWLSTIAGAFGFVLVFAFLVWRFVVLSLPQSDFEARAATFGDVTGSVFSALAFAGLIVTALMQWQELGLQREELRQTREELQGSRKAQEGSEAALQAQVKTAELTGRLNAATVLLEHYRSIQIDRPAALSDEDYADYLRQEGEKSRNIKEVLDEIISVRRELRAVVTFEVRVDVTEPTATGTATTGGPSVQQTPEG